MSKTQEIDISSINGVNTIVNTIEAKLYSKIFCKDEAIETKHKSE